jgi:pimeloyl-ACP methyl ester carboxylesterase
VGNAYQVKPSNVDLSLIHVRRWGEVGPRVVMVHGGVQGSAAGGEQAFAHQKPLSDHNWQLIVPDRPGHGKSPNPGRPDDAQADGEWVAELVAGGAHLVGHSFGGCVALNAAARRPDEVRSLTLIEPAMHQLAVQSPQVRRFLFRLACALWLSFSPARRATRAMDILGIPSQVQRPSDTEELKRLGRAMRRMRPAPKTILERELRRVRQAKIPLLVVSGGWSPAFEAMADVVAALGEGCRAVVPSAHHFPQFDAQKFDPLLNGFLRKSEGSKHGSTGFPA